jgi:hypothetical protein
MEYEVQGIDGIEGLAANATAARSAAKSMRYKHSMVSTNDLSAKAEFEKRIKNLPGGIQKAIIQGRLQVVDYKIYNVKAVGGLSNKELWESQDVKVYGLTNVNNRMLEANKWFLMTGIQLLSGVNANAKATSFGIADSNILNGEFELMVGSTILIPRISCKVFDTHDKNNSFIGFYKFSPQWIAPQTEIKPQIWTAASITADTNVKIVVHGATIEKN